MKISDLEAVIEAILFTMGEAVELEMLPKIYHRLTIEIPSLLLLNLIPLFILFLLKRKR